MQTEAYKRCPRCRLTLPTDAFRANRARYDGFDSECRECRKAAARARSDARLQRRAIENEARVNLVSQIPDDFANWLAGFIDGEGSFLIVRDRRSWRSDTFRTTLRLGLRADDESVLREIAESTGLGYVKRKKITPVGKTRPQVVWEVVTKLDCMALVRLLDAHPLRAKKARDYAVWREAVIVWHGVGFHRGGNLRMGGVAGSAHEDSWRRMAELRRQLAAVREWCDIDHESVLIPEPGQMQPVAAGDNVALF